jgi:hypothetical protein
MVTAISENLTSGTRSGSVQATRNADGVYEILTEGGAGANLVNTYRFDNVQPGSSHELLLKGNRPSNSENDNFQFSYSTTGQEGSFLDITGALIKKPFEPADPFAFVVASGSLSGTVYIRVKDTNPVGANLDSVKIDYLAIRTNP